MKRYASIIIFTTAILLFTACGNNSGEIESPPTQQPTDEQTTETPLPSGPEPDPESDPEPEPEPESDPDPEPPTIVDVTDGPLGIVDRITAVERDAEANSTSHFDARIISETLVDTGFGMNDDFGGCILVFELENISGGAVTVDISAVFPGEYGHAAWLIDQNIHFAPGQSRQFTHSFGEYNYSDSLHLVIEYWDIR